MRFTALLPGSWAAESNRVHPAEDKQWHSVRSPAPGLLPTDGCGPRALPLGCQLIQPHVPSGRCCLETLPPQAHCCLPMHICAVVTGESRGSLPPVEDSGLDPPPKPVLVGPGSSQCQRQIRVPRAREARSLLRPWCHGCPSGRSQDTRAGLVSSSSPGVLSFPACPWKASGPGALH